MAHDVSFRIALARMMVENLDSLVMDVETAFLYGDIEEEIFMKSPVGMEEIDPGSSPEDCYQLKKGIYGLWQAARQFWKKFLDTIKKEPFGFTVSPADPCMLFKENNLGICIIIMYVDVTEFRQPIQVQSHLEMPGILVQLGPVQHTKKLAPQTDRKWSPTWILRRYQAICPLLSRDGRYVNRNSCAYRTHSRP